MIWPRQMRLIQFFIQVTLAVFLLALAGCTSQPAKSGNTASPDQKLPTGRVIKQGLFEVIRSHGLVDSPNASTGKAFLNPVIQLVKQTDRIPLVKDAHMSLQYRIWNLPERPAYTKLRRVLIHPEMKLPDGSVSTGSDYMITGKVVYGQVIAYTGYGLNEDYEMVEGDWVFQIWYQDKKVIEQKFTTYWPEDDKAKKKAKVKNNT